MSINNLTIIGIFFVLAGLVLFYKFNLQTFLNFKRWEKQGCPKCGSTKIYLTKRQVETIIKDSNEPDYMGQKKVDWKYRAICNQCSNILFDELGSQQNGDYTELAPIDSARTRIGSGVGHGCGWFLLIGSLLLGIVLILTGLYY